MYITNVDQVIPILRTKLDDYLINKNLKEPNAKKFLCFIHEDHQPSMALNPKTNNETAHCFSCGATVDIFSAAAKLDQLPEKGQEFIQTTIPTLAEKLGVKVRLGTPSQTETEKLGLYRLAQDIADIIESPKYTNREYIQERNWANDLETCSSIDEDELISVLTTRGWSPEEINNSLLIRTSRNHFFGRDKVTFVIRDFRSRPVGFISRQLGNQLPKYINSTETSIYQKGEMPLGLDKALKLAKKDGLYLVEGPGDRAQLLRLGIYNVVAVNGTAVTTDLLNLFKTLGVKNIFFCLDWDNAGVLATSRIFQESLKTCPGLHSFIVEPPADMGTNTDPDSYLKQVTDLNKFLDLPKTSAFSWVMKNISDTDSPETVAETMIPIIAVESTAIKRELLIKELQEFTGLSHQAITQDVNSLRNNSQEQRKERILSATNQFVNEVNEDYNGLQVSLSKFESHIEIIEQEYDRDSIGVNYQLSRYDAIQLLKKPSDDGIDRTGFRMNHYKYFEQAMSGSMPWSTGTLIYLGGRANSGKTATAIAIGLDVVLSDTDTICIMHFTDDSYTLVEPRLKTNIGKLINKKGFSPLHIGQAANPHFNIRTKAEWSTYNEIDETFRNLITSERLIIIDSEDGPTLAPLEKTLRYIRQRYPDKKIMIIADNTHNYMDFPGLDKSERIAQISNTQKNLAIRYRACMIATAEYRKNTHIDSSKLKLPVNDDLADSRELMYRSNAIIHVYNDIRDRGDAAEFYWEDDAGEAKPRLLLVFGKNKITDFTKTLYLDMDGTSVTLNQVAVDDARADFESLHKHGKQLHGGKVVIEADALPEDEDDKPTNRFGMYD